MAGAPRGPRLDGARNVAPMPALGQSPNLRLPPPPQSQGQGASGAPPPISVTASRRGSGTGLPASGTPTGPFNLPDPPASATPTRQPPGLAPPASATPSLEAFLLEPLPQQVAPPAPPTTGPCQQPQPQQGTGTAAMVPGVQSQSSKEEYLSAVKAYEQQLGPNILHGKMYIESLPVDAVPPEQRFSTQTVAPGMVPGMAPGAECGYNMAMGVGPGQPCGYGRGKTMGGGYDAGRPIGGGYSQPIASARLSSGTSLAAQRSRERFKEFSEMDTALKFAELAEMGPEVKKLMDKGGRFEDIINLPRNYEAPMVQYGSVFAAPPVRAQGRFERPMNAAGGFGRQPMPGYGAPMRLGTDYACPPDRYDGPLDRYDGPADRYYDPSGRYSSPPDRYYGPPPNARSYGRRAFHGENSRSVREDELPGWAAPKQYSEKRAWDLLRKIREYIQEHYVDGMFQQIPREVAENETNEKAERRVRGGSLPHRTTSQRGIRDDDGESRRGRRFRDDYDVPRKSPPSRRQPSIRRQETSSSTSSDSKLRRSRKSAKKEPSCSSSSSSSDARRENNKDGGIQFELSITVGISSPVQMDLESIRKHCEAVVISVSSTRGGNGCPLPNMLGIRSREQESPNRPPSRNIVDVIPTYGIEERSDSQNFGGEIWRAMASRGRRRRSLAAKWWRTIASPFRNRREVEGYDVGVQRPPSRSFGEQAQRIRSHGSVYTYESKPPAFKRD